MPQLSGQVTVAAAGTAVQLTDITGYAFVVKALAGNTGNVYIGNDDADDVTASDGHELAPGDEVPIIAQGPPNTVVNLSNYWVDSATSGDKVSWLRVE